MIYVLIEQHLEALEANGYGFLRVFTFLTFQTTLAMMASFAIVLLAGDPVVRWLRSKKVGDQASFDQAEMDALMKQKTGTPTMGGVLIIGAILLTIFVFADLRNYYVLMALLCGGWLGAVGMADDWLKLTAARRSEGRQGLRSLEKLLFQVGLAVVLAVFTWYHGADVVETRTLYLPFVKDFEYEMSLPVFIVLAVLVMVGASNAVNLTDGLDGLAAGCMAIVGIAFAVLAWIVGISDLSNFLLFPHIPAAGQMALVSGACAGACLGFLWFNCNPARVFMGDTGSLALGGLIGYVAIVTRQELMLPIIGGIFVAEALSVMLQVSYYKYTKRRTGTGKRIFLISPLHNHFLRSGWTENQVVVRFWLLTAVFTVLALATVKLR